MKVVYIAGPYRAADAWLIEQNIRRAEALALEVWRMGAACLCPHCNTRHFQGAADDALWLAGDIAMLERCDALMLTPNWAESTGATVERGHALARGMPVFETLDDLRDWLAR